MKAEKQQKDLEFVLQDQIKCHEIKTLLHLMCHKIHRDSLKVLLAVTVVALALMCEKKKSVEICKS